jgi:hypothetical protein
VKMNTNKQRKSIIFERNLNKEKHGNNDY